MGTGECKDCFDWEKSAGKGKETEEWLSPGKQTDFCFRGEREDCLTDCLPAFSGSGRRTRRFQKLEKHTYTLVAKSDDVRMVFNDPTSLIKLFKYEEIISYTGQDVQLPHKQPSSLRLKVE